MTKDKYKAGDVLLHVPTGRKYRLENINKNWCVLIRLQVLADGNYWTLPYEGDIQGDDNYKKVEGAAI